MKKIIFLAAGLSLLLSASAASAQMFNSQYQSFYNVVNTGVCANLTSDLSVGSQGDQVRNLQTFLIAQNYPGGGSWMITGYYGAATQAAVRNFQQVSGLPITGSVDVATRAAINQASCGSAYNYNYSNSYYNNTYPYNNYYSNTNTNPYNYNYNTYPYNYPYNYSGNYGYNYNNCGVYPYYYSCYNNVGSAPTITSLNPSYGTPGTLVTVYGTGFDSVNNSVYAGGTTLRNVASYNGTVLSFTMPANVTGVVSVSVGNSYGVSNAFTFQTNTAPNVCGTYPYGPCGCAGGYGTYCPPPVNGQISLNYLSPASGAVGTAVTVYGWNFSPINNVVHFGNGIIAGLRSYDGTSLSFTIPSSLSGYGYQPIGLGTYDVSVTNSAGATSNTVPFTITSINSGGTSAPTITSVTGPTSLGVNVQGVWTIQLNNNQPNSYTTTSVNWGDQSMYGASLSANQTTYAQGNQAVTFTHTYTATGTYTITFTVTGVNGLSNSSSVTVNVGGSSTSTVTLSQISPTYGPVGTQVILYGNGFTAYDNTVHFGVGGTLHVASQNGTTIYFTIPYWISPCDLIGQGCAAPASQVTAGSYPVYVTNQNGTSQTLNFQVQ